MRKVWALIDIGDTLVGQPFETQEAAQAALEGLSYFGDMLEVREIDYNDEPLDEEGEELKLRLHKLLENTTHLHLSKGVKFYAMSLKERYRSMINMLEEAKNYRGDTSAPESDVEQVDIAELVKKL